MKVVQINSVCDFGSTGRIASGIQDQILLDNHESWIIYGRGKKSDEDNKIKFGNIFAFILHIFFSYIFDLHGFGSVYHTLKIIKKINIIKPDIVHLHNIHGYYLNYFILFKYLNKKRIIIVWTLHDCWSFTGHCAYYDFENCNKWIKKCNNCPQKKSYPKSLLLDNSHINYNFKKRIFSNIEKLTIVTPSIWLKKEVEKSFFNSRDIFVINNGIDLEKFNYAGNKVKESNKYRIIGVANKWERRKGLEYFVELSKLLSEDEECVLIGLDKNQISTMPSNIICKKRLSSIEELVDNYCSADVFFNFTLEDNFPTTNIEALACGLPIVTFNTGGSIESVGNCGKIVDKGDILSALEYFRSLREQDMISIKLKCSLRAKELYNKTEKFKEYVELYKTILMKDGNFNV